MAIDTSDLPFNPDDIYATGLAEVTQSSLTTYLTCKMKFVLAYLLRLRGEGISVPLVVGAAVHECLDFLMSPKNKKVSESDKRIHCRDRINSLFNNILETTNLATTGDPAKLEHGRAQALAVVEAWQVVHFDHAERFFVVQTEQLVRAPNTAAIGQPLEHRMAGKIDGIVVDYETMSVFILEHKTKYTLKDLNWMLGLDLNQQALFYATLYRVWLSKQPSTKLTQVKVKGKMVPLTQPAGMYYDAIAKPYHRSGSTITELTQRMVQAMLEDQSKYFSFTPIEMTPETVQHAYNNFDRIVQEMDRLDGENVTFNFNACDMYNGCPYRAICKEHPDPTEPGSILELRTAQLFRIGNLHNELDDLPTEDGGPF